MYYVSWRGLGLLGAVPPILGLVTLACLVDYPIRVALFGAGLATAVFGLALAVAGWVLNRNGNRHSLYGLPLWLWGGVEMVLGLALAGWIGFLASQSGWKKDSVTAALRETVRPVPTWAPAANTSDSRASSTGGVEESDDRP